MKINKHSEVLVSCSDREIWNFMELHAMQAYVKCMQAQSHETVCKLIGLHATSWNCMQDNGTACKLMEFLGTSDNLGCG